MCTCGPAGGCVRLKSLCSESDALFLAAHLQHSVMRKIKCIKALEVVKCKNGLFKILRFHNKKK